MCSKLLFIVRENISLIDATFMSDRIKFLPINIT